MSRTNQLKSSHRHFIHDEWASLQVCNRQIDNLLQQFRNAKDANISVCKSDYQTACTILDRVVSRDKSVSKLCVPYIFQFGALIIETHRGVFSLHLLLGGQSNLDPVVNKVAT
jgi:hypothetical protein